MSVPGVLLSRLVRRLTPELLGLLASLLVLGPAAEGQDRSLRIPGSPFLLDARDRVVGQVVDLTDEGLLRVGVAVGGRVSLVDVGRDGIVAASHLVGFETSACTGAASILSGSASLYRPGGLGPGNVFYGAAGPEEPRTLGSVWHPGPFPECIPEASPAAPFAAPAVLLVDLGTFEPPFRVE